MENIPQSSYFEWRMDVSENKEGIVLLTESLPAFRLFLLRTKEGFYRHEKHYHCG